MLAQMGAGTDEDDEAHWSDVFDWTAMTALSDTSTEELEESLRDYHTRVEQEKVEVMTLAQTVESFLASNQYVHAEHQP